MSSAKHRSLVESKSRMNIISYHRLLVAAAFVSFACSASAQWVTQSVELKAGWNAVFLHVDVSHDTLDRLVGDDASNPIVEVWQWNPPVTTQFTDSPQNPNPGSEWTSWVRTRLLNSLQRVIGDNAYLVRVGTNVSTYTWQVKGRPVPPRDTWTVTGLNLIGFPTVLANPPNFESFVAPSPDLETVNPDIYYYPGGELGVGNPLKLPPSLFRSRPVRRGQAFWLRAGEIFNDYFGPFEVAVGREGIRFHDNLGTASVRLRNRTEQPLTISVQLTASEASPAGQPSLASVPPLLIRGAQDLGDLSFGYTNLPTGTLRSWSLAPRGTPGDELEVVFGINRSAINLSPGSLLGGVLQFTDSLGHTRIDVPVSARVASSAGLWVGGAAVSQVGHYLKSYARGTVTNSVLNAEGEYETVVAEDGLLTTPEGRYVVTDIDTSIGDTPSPYPLRLIAHNPEVGNAILLQRVFFGLDASTNFIISRSESALSSKYLADARRLSSLQLPWTPENASWDLSGRLGEQSFLSVEVEVDYNDPASNPFVHSYHPDHDNLDASFDRTVSQGSESYHIRREIYLIESAPGDDFSSLVESGLVLEGVYAEIVTLRGLARAGGLFDERRFRVEGTYTLKRISDISTLTPAP